MNRRQTADRLAALEREAETMLGMIAGLTTVVSTLSITIAVTGGREALAAAMSKAMELMDEGPARVLSDHQQQIAREMAKRVSGHLREDRAIN